MHSKRADHLQALKCKTCMRTKARLISKQHDACESRRKVRATLSELKEEKTLFMLARCEAQRARFIQELREACHAYSHTITKCTADKVSSEARALKIEHAVRAKVLKTSVLKTKYVACAKMLDTHTK